MWVARKISMKTIWLRAAPREKTETPPIETPADANVVLRRRQLLGAGIGTRLTIHVVSPHIDTLSRGSPSSRDGIGPPRQTRRALSKTGPRARYPLWPLAVKIEMRR